MTQPSSKGVLDGSALRFPSLFCSKVTIKACFGCPQNLRPLLSAQGAEAKVYN